MAFLNFKEPAPVLASTAPAVRAEQADAVIEEVFGPREWRVIALAQNDGLASLSEPGRLSRLLMWAFGGDSTRKLADGRLETLRRLAVLAWHHGYAVPISEIKAFKDAGFSAVQLERLLASISARRPIRFRRVPV